jgi:hypothetical protein
MLDSGQGLACGCDGGNGEGQAGQKDKDAGHDKEIMEDEGPAQ